jgi:hypothetical protein
MRKNDVVVGESILTFTPRNISTSPIFGDGNHAAYLAVKQLMVVPRPSTDPITLSTFMLEGSASIREQYKSYRKSEQGISVEHDMAF